MYIEIIHDNEVSVPVLFQGPQGKDGPPGPEGPEGPMGDITPDLIYLSQQLLDARDETIQERLKAKEAADSIAATTIMAQLAFAEVSKPIPVVVKPELRVANAPLYIFSVNNDVAAIQRSIVSEIPVDSLFNAAVDVSINDRASFLIDPRTSGELTIPLKSATYAPVSPKFNHIVTNLSSISKKVMYLAIGDSLVGNEYLGIGGKQENYWGYPSKVIYNILRDRVDKPSIPVPLLIGQTVVRTRNFTYNGANLTLKGGSEGLAGWSAVNILRHAYRLVSKDVSSPGFVTAEVSYYLLGLQGKGGGVWSGTDNQRKSIRDTIQGVNPCDKNAVLYNWMKVQTGWAGANDVYTGTGVQNSNMDTFAEYMLDNPLNPFFSKTKARTAGATNAFSLNTYLSRYRTKDDNGNALTGGSFPGSKVTDVNANDVCLPTHITVSFGANDSFYFPMTTAAEVAAMMNEMANVIGTEQPSVEVGLLTYPPPGTNFPELYAEGIRNPKKGTQFRADLRTELISILGVNRNTTKSGKKSYVPAFEVTCSISRAKEVAGVGSIEIYAECAGRQIEFEGSDDVHNGLRTMASIADQVNAWIYSTLN